MRNVIFHQPELCILNATGIDHHREHVQFSSLMNVCIWSPCGSGTINIGQTGLRKVIDSNLLTRLLLVSDISDFSDSILLSFVFGFCLSQQIRPYETHSCWTETPQKQWTHGLCKQGQLIYANVPWWCQLNHRLSSFFLDGPASNHLGIR